MEKETKLKIIQMRKSGMGYKSIAGQLSLSVSAVRSVILSKYNDPDQYGVCELCGKRIQLHPGKKKRRFCSDRCRMKWWNTHRDCVSRKAFYSFICPSCGKQFISYGNKNRVYCSHDCYISSRYRKDGKKDG